MDTSENKTVDAPVLDEKEKKDVEQKVDNASSETKEEEAKRTENAEDKKGETSSEETKKEDVKPEDSKDEDKLVLKNLDLDLTYDVLSTPTCSHHEYRMVTFIVLWARANKIKYEFDNYGNVYLTKGELGEGEFYPCVTSHLDTVQREQEAYAQCGVPLQLLQRVNTKGGHELFVEGTGIGADDKAGILISLSLVKHFDKIKACFFLEEEVGCKGSEKLNKDWFNNVGYVIGWDSPDRNRAAYACSGELLMSKNFFEKIEQTCKDNGVTVFNSEPYTDVREIRKQTGVMCANFGNGGYNAHMGTEYVILEDIDGALGLGIALIDLLGTEKFRMPSKNAHVYNSEDEDIKFWYNKDNRYNYYGGNYNYNRGGTTYTSGSRTDTSKKSTVVSPKKSNEAKSVEPQVLEYIAERYEKHINKIEEKCEERESIILRDIKKLLEEKGQTELYADISKIFEDNLVAESFSTAIEF